MFEMNKVLLVGNLAQDPEIRSLTSGTALTEFNLAVNRRYKDRNGEWQKDTVFIRVETWGRLAEICGDWLKKGRRVFVEGRLKLDSWEAKDGTKRSQIKVTAETVQFIDAKGAENDGGASPMKKSDALQEAPQNAPEEVLEEPHGTDDDLPF
ncbi:single-stranded DNA-binding protein [Candidatus Sumerlaeota bacterium]|nr:single-stranded DNA-binding protein [Candidatus Sumerlaeota bacterium]